MFKVFSHLGHSHESESLNGMSMIDHCMPVLIGSGAIIAILLGVIGYMLVKWEPKRPVTAKVTKKTKK